MTKESILVKRGTTNDRGDSEYDWHVRMTKESILTNKGTTNDRGDSDG
jgi:hypothetical protein